MTINDDEILEDNESYEVTLQRTSSDLDNRIILAPMTAEIDIIDDDSKLHTILLSYMVWSVYGANITV